VSIVSAQAVRTHEENGDLARAWFRDHEAGTGPYALDSWQLGQQITLRAFPGYWRGWGGNHAKTVILRNVPESATQRLLIQSGEVDWADTISTDDAVALQHDTTVRVQVVHGLQQLYALMNTTKPPLNNVKVRQALVAAFPYDQMVTSIMHGLDDPARGFLPPAFPQHDRGPVQKYDLARARQLLSEAGFSNGGFSLSLLYFGPQDFEGQGAQLYGAELRKLGINLTIQGVSVAVATERRNDSDVAKRPDFYVFYAAPLFASPDALLYPLFYSKSTYYVHWTYANPRVDALLDEARSALSDADATRAYRQVQALLRDDPPAIPIMLFNPINVYRSRVKHVDVLPTNGAVVDYYSVVFGG